MPLANFREILSDARHNKYAVPCLIAGNIEMTLGQIMAAEEKRSPVVIAFPPHVMPAIPITLFVPFIKNAAEQASVPVAVELDHGFEFNEIMSCIKDGISAVMYDGSELDYEENIDKTKEIVKISHSLNVSVEAELGFVGGSMSDDPGKESKMTDPDKVVDFVSRTGVDALAVSIGNIHGKYRSEPRLDLQRLREISSRSEVPLVMHGGSGLTAADYRNVVENGISDVHFYSYLAAGVWPELKKRTEEIGRDPIYHELMNWTIEYYFKAAGNVIDMLNSANRANIGAGKSIYSDLIKIFKKQNTNKTKPENLNSIISEIVAEVLKNMEVRR
ncbi:MAG TPA: class II fructose-bisphosphate aldolase [Clostridia bacterium]|nr:class II fructose-bisphosphate aldolase [Clostridia bacterium]